MSDITPFCNWVALSMKRVFSPVSVCYVCDERVVSLSCTEDEREGERRTGIISNHQISRDLRNTAHRNCINHQISRDLRHTGRQRTHAYFLPWIHHVINHLQYKNTLKFPVRVVPLIFVYAVKWECTGRKLSNTRYFKGVWR